jgi:hypothetical protein
MVRTVLRAYLGLKGATVTASGDSNGGGPDTTTGVLTTAQFTLGNTAAGIKGGRGCPDDTQFGITTILFDRDRFERAEDSEFFMVIYQ